MGAIATLSQAPVSVLPGGDATCEVTFRNSGGIVDEYTVEPCGPAAAWTTVEPQTLALFPGAEGTVTLRFRPPRDAALTPGPMPFAVRFASSEDPGGSVVEEGTLDIETFHEVGAELMPRTSHARGRRRGHHEVAIDNRGNAPATVLLTPVDENEALEIVAEPDAVLAAPGTAIITKVKVRALKRKWRGQSVTRPFQLVVEPAEGTPTVLDGSFLQEPVFPKWLLKAVLIALAALVALVLLWKMLLAPVIKDVAADAAAPAAANAEKAADAANKSAESASDDAASAADSADKAAGGKGNPTPPPKKDDEDKPKTNTPVDPLGDPVSMRIVAAKDNVAPSIVPSKTALTSVTDILFQNPQADAGTVTLAVGDKVYYVIRLENFRDYDQHLIAPIEVRPGERVRMTVTCENRPTPQLKEPRPCTPALTLNGFSRTPADNSQSSR